MSLTFILHANSWINEFCCITTYYFIHCNHETQKEQISSRYMVLWRGKIVDNKMFCFSASKLLLVPWRSRRRCVWRLWQTF